MFLKLIEATIYLHVIARVVSLVACPGIGVETLLCVRIMN
jgi:hypothetical protein